MAKRRRPSRWLSQAALQALVRYGPEESGIRQATAEAKDTYRQTYREAGATGRAITYAIGRARPTVAHNYDAAGLSAARAAHVTDESLADPGVPASMRAAITAERTGFDTRLAESKAADLSSLSNQRVQAVQGVGFARSNARRVLASDLQKLFARSQALRGEKGAFTVATAQQLQTADERAAATLANQRANRGVTRRGQDLSHQDRVAARRRAANDKKSGPALSPDKHLEWRTAIDEITSAIGPYKGKYSRHEIVGKLAKGRQAQTFLVDKNGNPLPEGLSGPEKVSKGAHKVSLPAKPSYKPDLRMSAALDVALAGHLSATTQKRLHDAGFSVHDLGLPTLGQFRAEQRARARARNRAAGGKLLGPAF